MPAKPAAKGKGGGLKKPLMGMPVWAWVAAALVAVAVFIYMRRRAQTNQGATTNADVAAPVPVGAGVDSSGMSGGGAGDGSGLPTDQGGSTGGIPQSVLDELNWAKGTIQQNEQGLSDLQNQLSQFENSLGPNGTGGNGAGVGGGGPGDPGGGPGADTQTQMGVSWGGEQFTTRRGIAQWLSAHGASYGTWARRHPGAAARLTGPAPKASRAATTKQPKAKAPARKAAKAPKRTVTRRRTGGRKR